MRIVFHPKRNKFINPSNSPRPTRYFHGCKNSVDLASIQKQGFRSEFSDKDGRWHRDGNLGVGIYLSCDWKMSLWFGPLLLETVVQKGSRILDVSKTADIKTLRYLKKEFGAELLSCRDIRKIIPQNKNLRLKELVAITRHFYHLTWEKDWGNDSEGFSKWPPKRQKCFEALASTIKFLKQSGFHGYGDPTSDNGILIFAADRVKLQRVIAELDHLTHSKLINPNRIENLSMEELDKLHSTASYSNQFPSYK